MVNLNLIFLLNHDHVISNRNAKMMEVEYLSIEIGRSVDGGECYIFLIYLDYSSSLLFFMDIFVKLKFFVLILLHLHLFILILIST